MACSFLLGGGAYVLGLVLLGLACVITHRTARVPGAAGLVIAALTAPWTLGVVGALALLGVTGLVLRRPSRASTLVRMSVLLGCLAGVGAEIAALCMPEVVARRGERLVVVGDSLAAGVSAAERPTWPARLADRRSLTLLDLSVPGQTLGGGRARIARVPPGPAIVIVELGGNDLLQGGSVASFQAELDALVAALAGAERRIVLLELPAPPLHGGFVRAQRRVAARQGVTLVPRRLLASLLCDDVSRSDGVHLTAAGHVRLAEALSRVFVDR